MSKGRTKVIVDISISVDGFVTGPNDGPDNGLGDAGEGLHLWAMGERSEPADQEILDRVVAETGAVIMGRRTFDVVDGPHGWNEKVAYGGPRGADEPPHNFVLTHAEPESVRLEGAFSFVTDGVEAIVAAAREQAGERSVFVVGGGSVCSQVLEAGLADELRLHLAPLLLGGGRRLVDSIAPAPIALEHLETLDTAAATHLRYRVLAR